MNRNNVGLLRSISAASLRAAIPLCVLVALAGLVGSTPAIAQQRVDYRSPGNEFRIEFPGKATERSVPLSNGGTYLLAEFGSADGTYYFATTVPISPRQRELPVAELLDAVRDAQVKATRGKLRDEEPATIAGAPARRLIIDAPGPIVTHVLLVVTGDRLYQALCTAYARGDDPAKVRHFFDSLAVLAQ